MKLGAASKCFEQLRIVSGESFEERGRVVKSFQELPRASKSFEEFRRALKSIEEHRLLLLGHDDSGDTELERPEALLWKLTKS